MRFVIQPKYQSHSAFIARLPQQFEAGGEVIYAKRNVIKQFEVGGETWIAKRYKVPNLIQRMAYTFWRKSKAERAYLFAGRLRSIGIDTPEGIAYVECKRRGLFAESYFLCTACHHPPLFDVLVGEPQFDPQLATALAAFFVEMHGKGFLHGDPNLDNILYHRDCEGRFRFTVIDTNRSTFKSAPTRAECLDNLKRITHRRDLLQDVVCEYARLRGWDTEECVHQVLQALHRFERRRRLKHRLLGKSK